MSQRLEEIVFESTWTQAALAMFGAIQYTDKKHLTLVDVMGYTGHAFRMTIHEETADVAGPTEFDWGSMLSAGLKNLGFSAKHIGEPNCEQPTPELLMEAVNLVQTSVDEGTPVVAWDMFVPEFGLIYGYDDEKQLFKAKDISKDGELAYEKLGRGEIGELFVLAITDSYPIDRYSSLYNTLDMILDHAHNRQRNFVREPFKCGLAGYEAWVNAFTKRTVDPFGNSYNIQHVSCARDFAWKFLHTLSQEWESEGEIDGQIRTLAAEAANHYEQVAEALHPLAEMFPFPHGGEPDNDDNAEKAIHQLTEAKLSEEKGIDILECLYHLLSESSSDVS